MAKVWYCALIADAATPVRPPAGQPATKIDAIICAFGVEAETYYEAVGKAMAVKNRLREQHPQFGMWRCHVNELSENALIRDPATAIVKTTSPL